MRVSSFNDGEVCFWFEWKNGEKLDTLAKLIGLYWRS
jgi:hypothetical protein